MPHLEEGLVHAYLDDELETSEQREVDSHLRGCAQCRQLLEEAKGFMTEADQLVAAIELPLAPVQSMAAAPMAAIHESQLSGAAPVPRRRGNPLQLRWIAWAATVLFAVGLGYFSNEVRHDPRGPIGEADKAEPPSSSTGVVVRQQMAESAAGQNSRSRPAKTNATTPSEGGGRKDESLDLTKRRQPTPEAGAAAWELTPRRDEAADAAAIAPSPPASTAPSQTAAAKSGPDGAAFDNSFRAVALEEAVRLLGGTVRLIDGMTPKRVVAGPRATGAAAQLIRVVYEDPPGRELWLDQQGHRGEAENRLRASSESNGSVMLLGDTLVAPGPAATNRIQWVDQDVFQLTLTGYLPNDSLRALVRRVR